MFDLSACNVERTASGDYRVHWRCAGADQKVDIYMADDPEAYYAGQLPGLLAGINRCQVAAQAVPAEE